MPAPIKPEGGTPAPVAGTPEHDAAMLARAEGIPVGDNGPAATPHPAKVEEQRPAWLPEKFKTPEDFAKSYAELEGKLGAAKAPEQKPEGEAATGEKTEAQKAADEAGIDMGKYTSEFDTNGKLSDESYAALKEKGFDKATVDTYIAGQQAIAAQYTAKAHEAAGGAEALTAMSAWAAANLSPAEVTAYNAAVTSGDAATMQLAVAGLKARYTAENGTQGKPVIPNGPTASKGGFTTHTEMVTAMKDPRYKKDADYRREVEQRTAASTF